MRPIPFSAATKESVFLNITMKDLNATAMMFMQEYLAVSNSLCNERQN